MKKHFNYFFFFLAVFLVGSGFLFLVCISAPVSLRMFGTTNHYLIHQLIFGLLPGVILAIAAYKIPLHFFKKYSPVFVFLNLVALLLVFSSIGSKFYGASRWISIGNFIIQPSEFFKITAILYLSTWIASKLSEVKTLSWKSGAKKGYHNLIYVFIPFAVFLGVISAIMIFQPNISTLGIITLTLLVMYFSAKTPLWHTLSIVAIGFASLLFLIKIAPYRFDRLLVFLNPEADPLGKSFQLKQSLIAIGSGGLFGKGIGMSVQKFGNLPQAMSDFVFAVLAEETGIIGCSILIALFILFFWLGIRIAKSSSDKFSKLAAVGITFWITLQAFINIASVTGIFPISGIPLPFFSYGGSHLVTELIGIGLLLNISKNS